jgi:hypothetical protein
VESPCFLQHFSQEVKILSIYMYIYGLQKAEYVLIFCGGAIYENLSVIWDARLKV